jgi:ribonuclease R
MLGVFEARGDGSGVVVLDATGDKVLVPMAKTLGALSGDRVAVRLEIDYRAARRGGRKPEPTAAVERLLEAGPRLFVGTLLAGQAVRVLVPDGRKATGPLLVDGVPKGTPGNVKAVVEMGGPDPNNHSRPTTARLIKILGDERDPRVVLEAIRLRHGLIEEFDEDVERQAQAAAQAPIEDGVRRLLSELLIVTIDPADAKDFDDAVSIVSLKDGGHELGVHIADVASYVPLGSAIDREARRRGTSVYLPGRVLPMLPHALSSGACSLRPLAAKRTLSAFMTFDAQGVRTHNRFERTAICSAARLTYEQAQDAIDGRNTGISQDVGAALKLMSQLARLLLERRARQGMLSLDLPEIELVLGEDGGVVDARPKPTLLAHRLIEMFMVEANEAVAEELHGKGIDTVRRIHEPPSPSHLEALSHLSRALGFDLPQEPTRADLVALLEKTTGTKASFALHYAVLRALSQARYSPVLEGHFALASKHYCHFTSPIRRYPDLVVHRTLTDCLLGRPPSSEAVLELESLAAECSATERRAAEVERDARTALVLLHLAPRIGEEFEGVITAVTDHGMFVQWPRYLVDGMVRYEDLGGQWWEASPMYGLVRGAVTGQVLRVGDPLRVQLAAVWPSDGRLDLRPVPSPNGTPAGPCPKPRTGGRRAGGPKAGQEGRGDRRRRPSKRR